MAKIITETANMSRDEWLKLRKEGIGGSDAAAIAGVNPYKSPVVAYMEKTGQYTPKPAGEAAEWGNILEPVIRKVFAEKINAERELSGLPALKVQQRNAIFSHDEFDFMRTNLDGLIYGHELGKGILEIKTANQFLTDEWAGDDVPNQYYIQVQHNIAVMNVQYAYLPVLIGGQKFKYYFIERDEEMINYLYDIERNFWINHVKAKTPPQMDGSDSTKDMLNDLYGNSDPDLPPVELPIEFMDLVNELEEIKSTEKELKERKNKAQNIFKDNMQDCEVAFTGPHMITWKESKNGQRRFTYKLNKREVNE